MVASAMAYSGWRFSCDLGTLERCAGALEIEAKRREANDPVVATWLGGAAAALRCILADGDGMDPEEFVWQVMVREGEKL